MNSEELTDCLHERITEVLGKLVPKDSTCALLDFPNHSNVGDSAIWLGEKKLLAALGARLVYECEVDSYSEGILASRIENGIIFLHGGGNFGDVWPKRQLFREKVIRAFPNNRIIIFPQTIFFGSDANLVRAKAVLNKHPNLVILARDERSLRFARKEFHANTLLCPDMALMQGRLRRPSLPEHQILWLARTDSESKGPLGLVGNATISVTDWLDEASTATRRAYQILSVGSCRHPRIFARLAPLLSTVFDRLAWQRVLRGVRILSRGKVVITDRLHAHVLSLLLGTPHILLDNSYGKVSDFYRTWTSGCETVRWANSVSEALEQAKCITQTGAAYARRAWNRE